MDHKQIYTLVHVLIIMFNIRLKNLHLVPLLIVFQSNKTELNYILINLVVSDIGISFIGVPIDLLGAATNGEAIDNVLCQIVAFTHTLLGNQLIHFRMACFNTVYIINISLIFTAGVLCSDKLRFRQINKILIKHNNLPIF